MTNGLPYGNLQLYLVLCCVCSWLTLPVFDFSSNCKPYTWVDLCFVWICVETVGFVIWLFWRSTWVFLWWTGELSQHDTAVVSLCLLVVLCLHRKIYVYLKPWILSSRNICPVPLLCAGIQTKYKYIDIVWSVTKINELQHIDAMWFIIYTKPNTNILTQCDLLQRSNQQQIFHSLWWFQISDKLQIYEYHIICYKCQINHKYIDTMWSIRKG